MSKNCPCGHPKVYDACCGRYIQGHEAAPDPESLMRSRYSAYTLGAIDYIAATMRSPAADGFDPDSARRWALDSSWQGLQVRSVQQLTADQGTVEFIARFVEHGEPRSLHEISQFRRIDNHWYYVDGELSPKLGRNDPCPCGSGKKVKKCCGQ